MSKAKSSKSPKRSQKNKILEEDQIDEILEKITLKRPRNAYTQFCMEEVEKFKNKNKNKKIELKTFSGECAGKWQKLSDKEKGKYNDRYEEEKLQYRKDLDTVRHYLFMDYNDIVHRPPTAYRLYLNEKLREGFEKNEDPKAIKKKASDDWRRMSIEEKQEYIDKKKENDTWFEKAKKIRKVTPLTIFVQRTIDAAKSKQKDIPKLADIAETWKSLKASDKEKYGKYADAINEEREKLQHIYELIHGMKPKRPAGAFRVFLQEKAKEKVLHSLQEGKELWDKLSEDEKESYLKKSHTLKLAYKYKKMIYDKKIKKILPKKPATAYGYFLKEKKGMKVPKGERPLTYWRPYYDELSKDKKKKYEEKAAREKERYQKKMDEFKNVVFDMPKRPLNAFTLYVRDRIPDLRKEKNNEKAPVAKLLKMAAKEWTSEDGVSQRKYEKKAEQDKKRFKKQLKDFETLGYYKKNYRAERTKKEEDDDDDEEEEEEKTTKRKKRSSSSKKGTKKTRSKSRSKSKSKTQDMKRRTKSGKKSSTQKRK